MWAPTVSVDSCGITGYHLSCRAANLGREREREFYEISLTYLLLDLERNKSIISFGWSRYQPKKDGKLSARCCIVDISIN